MLTRGIHAEREFGDRSGRSVLAASILVSFHLLEETEQMTLRRNESAEHIVNGKKLWSR